jgi:hypothetical protein
MSTLQAWLFLLHSPTIEVKEETHFHHSSGGLAAFPAGKIKSKVEMPSIGASLCFSELSCSVTFGK